MSNSTSRRTGSVTIMVLLILVVAVMMASSFIALMSSYHESGTRLSARQIAAQTALAGAVYSQQFLLRDYAAAQAANIPQCYNAVPSQVGSDLSAAQRSYRARAYAGPLPADSTGLDWLLPFEGRLHTIDTASYAGSGASSFMARYTFQANHHPNASGGVEPTRRGAIDSLASGLEIPLRYAAWDNFWYTNDGGGITYDSLRPNMSPFRNGVLAQPRWWTAAYYDLDFQPLPWSDRALAAYEARFAITPIPLDGCININFDERILSATNGGLYRLGYRNPNVPPGATAELPIGVCNSAVGSGRSTFNNDAAEVDRGDKVNLDYDIGDSTTVSVTASYPYQAYQVTTADDMDWTGKSFPLAQQYAASLTNMLGALVIRDGGATVRVRKTSNVTWSAKYDNYNVSAEMVLTGGLRKATSGMGELSMLVNCIFGQGYRGNRGGYDTAIPGDPWYAPTVAAGMQIGTPASWRQLHANMGFNNNRNSVTANDNIMPIVDFSLSPFGSGLNRTRVPVRNKPTADLADIDCPWYVNAMVMNQATTKAMICGMDPTWYRNFDNINGNTGDSSGYPLGKGDLLPTPPPKADPTDGSKIAVWDDGMALTGADGVEGGALPPIKDDLVLTTGYRRPPVDRNDPNNYENAFHTAAYDLWKNPMRDQSVSRYGVSPYTAKLTGGAAYSSFNRKISGDSSAYVKREDYISQFAIDGDYDTAMSVENANGSDAELLDNTDTADERLAWQNDIVSALLKTVVDLRFDRNVGHQLHPATAQGYESIEDVEAVFLGYLGIAVRYTAATSKASTVATSAADYEVYYGMPFSPDVNYPLGRFNQLWALSQLTSGAGMTNEIGYDRGRQLNTGTSLSYSADGIIDSITEATAGQFGYRSYLHSSWPTVDGNAYHPTWAALSRVLEHRLNDVRMSLFGTPALDLNGDGFVDATTNDGFGEVDTAAPVNAARAQLRFSSTGRLYLGQNRYWRLFINAELWDRRGDTLADESSMEQVFVVDPNGDGDLSDSHTLFSRRHANVVNVGRDGPTSAGRTEASLP